ncbi:NACHT domain-containing protein [Streptomyces canus]|uniref:NACHT domain-containing protein n=1 Tax=Streptomyces canus TaxID=58343 RepID=UPI0033A9CAB2
MRRTVTGIVSAVCAIVLLPVATNYATAGVPGFLADRPWLAWVAIAVLGTVAVLAASNAPARLAARRTPSRADDRDRLVARVRAFVDQRLGQSLGGMVRAELELDKRGTAVVPPLAAYAGDPDGWDLAPGTTIAEAFTLADESLLMLGEPGAGKSTLLLDLASALLEGDGPVPVILELAFWEEPTRDADSAFTRWICERIEVVYRFGRDLSRAWLEADRLILLFDGLDELPNHRRADCVARLNALQDAYPRLRMAVTCRTTDYDALPLLHLRGAAEIRPLTDDQIDRYLTDPASAALRTALTADPTLRELMTAPLWLNLMTLAFQTQGSTLTGTTAERRTSLFDHYVHRMLSRPPRGGPARHDDTTTVRALAAVAAVSGQAGVLPLQRTLLRVRVKPEQGWHNLFRSVDRFYCQSTIQPWIGAGVGVLIATALGTQLGISGLVVGGVITLMSLRERGQGFPSSPRPSLAVRLRWWAAHLLTLLLAAALCGTALTVSRYLDSLPNGVCLAVAGTVVIGPTAFCFFVVVLGGDGPFLVGAWGFMTAVEGLLVWWASPLHGGGVTAVVLGTVIQPLCIIALPFGARFLTTLLDSDLGFPDPWIPARLSLTIGGLLLGFTGRLSPSVGPPQLILLLVMATMTNILRISLDQRRAISDPLGFAAVALSRVLPWRLRRLLDEATRRGLLLRDPAAYRFPHALIREHFARLDPKTAQPPHP